MQLCEGLCIGEPKGLQTKLGPHSHAERVLVECEVKCEGGDRAAEKRMREECETFISGSEMTWNSNVCTCVCSRGRER